MAEEEVFKVDTGGSDSEDQTIKVDQDFEEPEKEDDGIVLETSTGKWM